MTIKRYLRTVFDILLILAIIFLLGWAFSASYGTVDLPVLNINAMKLHEKATFNVDHLNARDTYVDILKVHGGWIYYSGNTAVFVHE